MVSQGDDFRVGSNRILALQQGHKEWVEPLAVAGQCIQGKKIRHGASPFGDRMLTLVNSSGAPWFPDDRQSERRNHLPARKFIPIAPKHGPGMASRHQDGNWSAEVTEHSNALDLEEGVFTLDDPRVIARSLKHSAEQSRRRKVDPYRSAMSMLTFYINRAGSGLSAERRAVLGAAKDALRREFGREPKRHEPKKRTGRSRSS